MKHGSTIPPVVLVEGEVPCEHVGPRRWERIRDAFTVGGERGFWATTTVYCGQCGAVMDVTRELER